MLGRIWFLEIFIRRTTCVLSFSPSPHLPFYCSCVLFFFSLQKTRIATELSIKFSQLLSLLKKDLLAQGTIKGRECEGAFRRSITSQKRNKNQSTAPQHRLLGKYIPWNIVKDASKNVSGIWLILFPPTTNNGILLRACQKNEMMLCL